MRRRMTGGQKKEAQGTGGNSARRRGHFDTAAPTGSNRGRSILEQRPDGGHSRTGTPATEDEAAVAAQGASQMMPAAEDAHGKWIPRNVPAIIEAAHPGGGG